MAILPVPSVLGDVTVYCVAELEQVAWILSCVAEKNAVCVILCSIHGKFLGEIRAKSPFGKFYNIGVLVPTIQHGTCLFAWSRVSSSPIWP